MGYIEDIQKINKLAQELLQHGIVDSLDQAVIKAKDMISKKDGGAVVENRDMPNQAQTTAQVEPRERQEMTWKEAMAKNNEFIVREITEFKKQLSSVVQELQDLRKETQRTPRPAQQEQITIDEPTAKRERQQATHSTVKKDDQIQGGFTSADVKIEEMFYFGNK